MHPLTELAIDIARGAGDLLRRALAAGDATVSHKGAVDLVTSADHASEAYVIETIRKHHPDHAILAEESGRGGEDGPFRWIIDPLDGTTNFAHGLPHFAVLIAVQERRAANDFETIAGITFDPMRDELFVAERGGGATLNGRPMHVSSTERLIDAVATTGFRYDRLFVQPDNHREFCRLNLLTQGVRRLGSAGLDLAYVACGRMDLFWEYGLKAWDVTAGELLVREAGGTTSDLEGGPADLAHGSIVATNGVLHSATLDALSTARRLPIGSREGLAEQLPAEVAAQLQAAP